MMKNDITYEYRVFTHRLIDLEQMEVGICTSKVIKGLKPKDKVNGRFFHTSDTDEWFFCWNNELQKLNLKGNSDINEALDEVKKLIANANDAVNEAKKIAGEAKVAAEEAKAAVESIEEVSSIANAAKTVALEAKTTAEGVEATASQAKTDAAEAKAAADAAVESIDKLEEAVENKADKGAVEDVTNAIKTKQDVITDLSDIRANSELAKTALQSVPDEYVTETELARMNYATIDQVNAKQDAISDLDVIRANAELAKSALQEVPAEYVTETELAEKGYLTAADADLKYAPIGSEGVDLGEYATKDFVSKEIEKLNIPTVPKNVSEFTNDAGYLTSQDITGKQDVIEDLADIRANAELAKKALQVIPEEYVTETELAGMNYATIDQVNAKQDAISDLETIRTGAAAGATALQSIPEEYVTEEELAAKGYLTEHQSLDNYYTKKEVDDKIDAINTLIGQAIDITKTILA